MALDSKKIQFPFGQGLAQEIAPALVPPGKLLTAEQVVIDKTGAMQERPGTDALSAVIRHGTSVAEGGHIFADGRETVITTPDRVLSYSEADSKWRDIDDGYEADIHRVITGERNGEGVRGVSTMDIGYASNWIVYAWLGGAGGLWNNQIYVRFVDYETGAHTRTFNWPSNSASTDIRVLVVGSYIHVIWNNKSTDEIKTGRFTIADISAGPTFVVLATDSHSTFPVFDACSCTSTWNGFTSGILLAYRCDAGAGDFTKVERRTPDGTGGMDANVAFIGAPPHVVNYGYTVACDGTRFWVAYDTWNGATREIHAFAVSEVAVTTTLLAVTQVTTVEAVGASARIASVADATNSRLWITWEETYTASSPREVWGRWFTIAGVASGYHHVYHVGLLSKPWLDDGKVYVFFYLSRGEATKGSEDVTSVYQRNAYLVEQMTGGSVWIGED